MSPHPESHTYLTAADLADPNKRMPINPDRGCLGSLSGCVPALRVQERFTKNNEAMMYDFYVPGAHLTDQVTESKPNASGSNLGLSGRPPIKNSGVTVRRLSR
jgi:hypothetical protein